jgi:hypothetical protein
MGEVKKYFLNQFNDLENQLKIAICGSGALALLNFKSWGLGIRLFFKFFFKEIVINSRIFGIFMSLIFKNEKTRINKIDWFSCSSNLNPTGLVAGLVGSKADTFCRF